MAQPSIHIGSDVTSKSDKSLNIFGSEVSSMTIVEKINYFFAGFTPINVIDKVTFFRLLATMINAGISIVKALNILIDQLENFRLKKITKSLMQRIETGTSLSEAMLDHPKIFTEAQVGMVESGEASGRLNQSLINIAEEMEKSAALLSKVKSAMIYPVVILTVMIAAGFGVMTYVIPKVKDMFASMGGELPPSTQRLIEFSDYLIGKTMGIPNAILIILMLTGFVFLFIMWKRTAWGNYLWTKIVFYIPVFGKLSKKVALARFCRILSTMVASGISIIKALRITADTIGNPVYQRRIHRIADDVRQGITIAENIKDDPKHFPSIVVGMMTVAEQTAQIDTITAKIADFYEEEVNNSIKGLSNLMEPIILLILGSCVAFLVISVMTPILTASDLAAEM